ncbi:hypothetical protein BDV39DRAFT_202889 [Aspergillus sergii]|uniref:Uncharacterized protein n=1 Tax=Aspergillus sergii TaxID=1034303 RepID=A0A5N6X9S2_9EURO|nr:hypothetical protein BDV39DRAFT_202889 [Aspergillus sergii]
MRKTYLEFSPQTIIATAIPRITDDFPSLGDVAWYGSAFFLVTAGFQTASMSCPRLVKKHATPSAVGFFFFGSYIVVIYDLPIYFQNIEGTSPISSDVHNLPFILAVSIFTVLSGNLIFIPALFVMSGAAVDTIGCGLSYTFNIGNSTNK